MEEHEVKGALFFLCGFISRQEEERGFHAPAFGQLSNTVCLKGACGLMICFLLIPPLLNASVPQGQTEKQHQKPTEALELPAAQTLPAGGSAPPGG